MYVYVCVYVHVLTGEPDGLRAGEGAVRGAVRVARRHRDELVLPAQPARVGLRRRLRALGGLSVVGRELARERAPVALREAREAAALEERLASIQSQLDGKMGAPEAQFALGNKLERQAGERLGHEVRAALERLDHVGFHENLPATWRMLASWVRLSPVLSSVGSTDNSTAAEAQEAAAKKRESVLHRLERLASTPAGGGHPELNLSQRLDRSSYRARTSKSNETRQYWEAHRRVLSRAPSRREFEQHNLCALAFYARARERYYGR